MQQEQRSQVVEEWGKFAQCVDWLYEQSTVPLTLLITVLYWAPHLGDWRAYIIVPAACLLIPLLCTKFVLFCHQRGFLRYVYDAVHAFISGAFIRLWLGVTVLRQSKPGQLALCFAAINLIYFGGYWCYANVDLLKLGRSLCLMVYTLVTSLRDPPAIMRSFHETLRTMSIYNAMEYVRVQHVDALVQSIDGGGTASVLVPVLVTSALLVLMAFVFYWFPNIMWPAITTSFGKKPQQSQQADRVYTHSPLQKQATTC